MLAYSGGLQIGAEIRGWRGDFEFEGETIAGGTRVSQTIAHFIGAAVTKENG